MERFANDESTVNSIHSQLAAAEVEAVTSETSCITEDREIKAIAVHCSTESNSDIDECVDEISTDNAADNVDGSVAAENCVDPSPGTMEGQDLEDKQISALMAHEKQRHQQLLLQHINQLRQLQKIHKTQQRKRQLNNVPCTRPNKPQREPRQDQWLQEHRQKRKQNLKQHSKQQQKQNRQQQKEKQPQQMDEPSHDPDQQTPLPCDGKSASIALAFQCHTLDTSCATATPMVDQTESQCSATEPVGSESKRNVESIHCGNDMLYGPTSAVMAKSSTSENYITTCDEDDVCDVKPQQTLLGDTNAEDYEVIQSTACDSSTFSASKFPEHIGSVAAFVCTPTKTPTDGLDHITSDLSATQSVNVVEGVLPPHKTKDTEEADAPTITKTAVSENTAGTTVDVAHHGPLRNSRVAGEDSTDDTAVTCGTAVTVGKISPQKLLHDIKMMEIQIRSISKRDRKTPSANKQRSSVKDACSTYSNGLHLCSSAEANTRSTSLTAEDNGRSASVTHATSVSFVADIHNAGDQNGHVGEDDAACIAQTAQVSDNASEVNKQHRPCRSLLDSGFDGGTQPAHEEDIKFVPLSPSFAVTEDFGQPSADIDSDSILANQHHQRKRWIDSDWGHVLADNEKRVAGRQPSTKTRCSAEYLLTMAPEQIGDEDSTRRGQRGNGSHKPRTCGHGSTLSPERSQRTARSASPLGRPVVFCPPISTDHDISPATKNLSYR